MGIKPETPKHHRWHPPKQCQMKSTMIARLTVLATEAAVKAITLET
jgi:hypothetical protein